MESTVDIRMALGSDLIGMILVIVMIVGNIWRLKLKTKESKVLIAMLGTCFSCCLSDIIAFAVDGNADHRELVYFANTWLFASNFLCAYSWFIFLKEHFNVELTASEKWSMRVMKVVLLGMLLVNLYSPFIFLVDEFGIYSRKFGYWIYLAFNYAIIVNSLVLYYKNYRQDGAIRFFPIWMYIIPIAIATVVQSMYYGISLMSASLAVAIAGAFSCLQNEQVFKDHLTGLFNRSFLDYVLFLYSQKGRKASGIMISLCDFQEINEKFGHEVGDHALQKAADIIRDSVGHWGSILRYSGDEFIIMVDSQYDMHISNCIEKLNMNFDKFNRTSQEPYALKAAIGYKKHEANSENINGFLNGLAASVKKAKEDYSK